MMKEVVVRNMQSCTKNCRINTYRKCILLVCLYNMYLIVFLPYRQFVTVHNAQTDVSDPVRRRNTELRRSDGAKVLSLQADIEINTFQSDYGNMALFQRHAVHTKFHENRSNDIRLEILGKFARTQARKQSCRFYSLFLFQKHDTWTEINEDQRHSLQVYIYM